MHVPRKLTTLQSLYRDAAMLQCRDSAEWAAEEIAILKSRLYLQMSETNMAQMELEAARGVSRRWRARLLAARQQEGEERERADRFERELASVRSVYRESVADRDRLQRELSATAALAAKWREHVQRVRAALDRLSPDPR